jgi:phosphate transport system protein
MQSSGERDLAMNHEHTDRSYEQELAEIRNHVTRMGTAVCDMLARSLRALATGNREEARSTIAADPIVNRLEVETDELCLSVLARRQPVASDLRFIATALKLDTDLERIGDLCVNVCERLLQLDAEVTPDVAARLMEMGARVQTQIETALRAFVNGDVTLAQAVLDSDDIVDRAYADTSKALLTRMLGDSAIVGDGTRLQSIAKYIERMGDHATNLAEMVIFMVEGRDVRHPGRIEERRRTN